MNSGLDQIRQWRKMFQMKEEYKTPKEELTEVETGSLPKKGFRDEQSSSLCKDYQRIFRRKVDAQREKLRCF